MRLPHHKLYRAFPELDPFDDAECQGFVRRARRRRWLRLVCFPLLTATATLGIMVMILEGGGNTVPFAMLAFMLVGVVGAPPVTALLVRDCVLRGAVRELIGRAVCTGCGFSLLGLREHGGTVRCPECGNLHTLHLLGITPADLIAKSASPTSAITQPQTRSPSPRA